MNLPDFRWSPLATVIMLNSASAQVATIERAHSVLVGLKRARCEALHERVELLREQHSEGMTAIDNVRDAELSALDADMELTINPQMRLKYLQDDVESALAIENHTEVLASVGSPGGEVTSVLAARAKRLRAEVRMLRAKNEIASGTASTSRTELQSLEHSIQTALRDRAQVLKEMADACLALYDTGRAPMTFLCDAQIQHLRAQLEIEAPIDERVALANEIVAVLKKLHEDVLRREAAGGRGGQKNLVFETLANRLGAEIELIHYQAAGLASDSTIDRLASLRHERSKALNGLFEATSTLAAVGQSELVILINASEALRDAELELATSLADQRAALFRYRERANEVQGYLSDGDRPETRLLARAHVLDAESRLIDFSE